MLTIFSHAYRRRRRRRRRRRHADVMLLMPLCRLKTIQLWPTCVVSMRRIPAHVGAGPVVSRGGTSVALNPTIGPARAMIGWTAVLVANVLTHIFNFTVLPTILPDVYGIAMHNRSSIQTS